MSSMNKRGKTPVGLIGSCLLAASCWASPVHSATPVYADATASCGGLTPCFSSIQEAVDNAGPAPAEVGIFPGTYAENVDLSAMGSAIGDSPGAISLQALDASGQPATDGVMIDPGAGGGSGTGLGLTTGATSPFAGDISLRGLFMTSPDSSGFALSLIGNLTLEDFTLEGSGTSGGVTQVDGNVVLARGLIRLNSGHGLVVDATGTTQAEDLTVLRNQTIGLGIRTEQMLTINGVESSLNEDGLIAAACQDVSAQDVLTELNAEMGALLLAGPDACDAIAQSSSFTPQAWSVPDPGRRRSLGPSVPAGTSVGNINATMMTSTANGNFGIGVFAPAGKVSISQVGANDNTNTGMIAEASSLFLSSAQLNGNGQGALIDAGTVELIDVTASDSLPMPTNPPFDGTGIVVIAGNALMETVSADNNPTAGLLLVEPEAAVMSDFTILSSQFDGNEFGIATISDNPMDMELVDVGVTNNLTSGMVLTDIGLGRMTGVTAASNSLGMVLNVLGQLEIETSEVSANVIGVNLTVGPSASARIGCSDIFNNTDAGLELVEGDAADARSNFWGDATGPSHPDNPPGTGDVVRDSATGHSGTVDYSGFLTEGATQQDCLEGGSGTPQAAHAVPALHPHLLMLLMALVSGIALIVIYRHS